MKINLHIARETAWMLGFKTKCKNLKKVIALGVLDHVELLNVMPAQRSADKVTLSFYVNRALDKRLRKMAKLLNTTLTDVVVMVLTKEMANVELTAEDYEEIAKETRAAKHQNRSRPKKASPKGI